MFPMNVFHMEGVVHLLNCLSKSLGQEFSTFEEGKLSTFYLALSSFPFILLYIFFSFLSIKSFGVYHT